MEKTFRKVGHKIEVVEERINIVDEESTQRDIDAIESQIASLKARKAVLLNDLSEIKKL